MYRFQRDLFVDHMLGDIRDLRSRLDEIHGLQIALGSNQLPWCTPRHRSAALDLLDRATGLPDRAELDDLLIDVARNAICLGKINKALDYLEAVLIPRHIYR